jgi:hypothetical protein
VVIAYTTTINMSGPNFVGTAYLCVSYDAQKQIGIISLYNINWKDVVKETQLYTELWYRNRIFEGNIMRLAEFYT